MMSQAKENARKLECGNCNWKGSVKKFHNTGGTDLPLCESLGERLTPGDPVPFGDCPACQCFVYLKVL